MTLRSLARHLAGSVAFAIAVGHDLLIEVPRQRRRTAAADERVFNAIRRGENPSEADLLECSFDTFEWASEAIKDRKVDSGCRYFRERARAWFRRRASSTDNTSSGDNA